MSNMCYQNLIGTSWKPKKSDHKLPWKITDVYSPVAGRTAVQLEKYQGGRNSPAIITIKQLNRNFKKVMSKKGKTEIILVVDRSGSMISIKKDMEGGLNTYIEDQKKIDGEVYVTYYRFDNQFEKVFELQALDKTKEILILPRGGTALTDAIGLSINEVQQRNDRTPEAERAETTIFIVITDEGENASVEYSSDQVKKMVSDQKTKEDWRFIFMGANIDAVTTGDGYGIPRGSSFNFRAASKGVAGASNTLNNATSYYRASVSNTQYVVSKEELRASMEE